MKKKKKLEKFFKEKGSLSISIKVLWKGAQRDFQVGAKQRSQCPNFALLNYMAHHTHIHSPKNVAIA